MVLFHSFIHSFSFVTIIRGKKRIIQFYFICFAVRIYAVYCLCILKSLSIKQNGVDRYIRQKIKYLHEIIYSHNIQHQSNP